MKPLTIDELKSLEIGDWVWISRLNNKRASGYVTDINFTAKMFTCKSVNRVSTTARIADYGTKWLAYKNKEMAESKGEIVELPCIAMVEQGRVDGKFKPTKEAQQFNGRYAVVYFDKNKYSKPLIDICWSKDGYYKYKEAERRLAELKGEYGEVRYD